MYFHFSDLQSVHLEAMRATDYRHVRATLSIPASGLVSFLLCETRRLDHLANALNFAGVTQAWGLQVYPPFVPRW